ncbi:hypothetical protein PFISCL1PPCAC_26811, partial [Pristionchus fissidentatus]
MFLRLLFLCLLFLANTSCSPTPRDVDSAVEEMLRKNLNFSADPCDDFYNYVCGNWMANNEIPHGQEIISAETNIFKNIRRQQREIIETISDSVTSSAEMKLRNFHRKCIDIEDIEKSYIDMISELKKLGPFPIMGKNYSKNNSFDLSELFIKAHSSQLAFQIFPDLESGNNMILVGAPPFTVEGIELTNHLDPLLLPDVIKAYKKYLIEKVALISEEYNSTTTLKQKKLGVKRVIRFTTEFAKILSTESSPQTERINLSKMQTIFPVVFINIIFNHEYIQYLILQVLNYITSRDVLR